MTEQIINGNYFLHISLLKEATDSWRLRKQQTKAGMLFMKLFGAKKRIDLDICACDRTLKEINSSENRLGFSPALYDIICEKFLRGYDTLDNEEYILKVASKQSTNPYPNFLIVSESKKTEIITLANEKGYGSIKILSPSDFEL